MDIEVDVVGTFCNSWPNLIIEINNRKIYDDNIIGTQSLNLKLDQLMNKNNQIILGMVGKNFGKNNLWDTKIVNNKIIEDKTIRILSLRMEGVECKDLFDSKFNVKRTDRQPYYQLR